MEQELLSRTKHGDWRLSKIEDWRQVPPPKTLPVTGAEAIPLAAALPLVFEKAPEGVRCVVLLRLLSETTIYIGPDGTWRAPLLPPQMVLHPFGAGLAPEGGVALTIDPTSPSWSSDGQPLFDETGEPSADVLRASDFLERRRAELDMTKRACSALFASGLLQPLDIPGADGLFAARQDAVASEALGAVLQRSGADRLLVAHQVSRVHLDTLMKAEKLFARAPLATNFPPKKIAKSDTVDFLAQMASSRSENNDVVLYDALSSSEPNPV